MCYTMRSTHARTSNVVKCKLTHCVDVYNEWNQYGTLCYILLVFCVQ